MSEITFSSKDKKRESFKNCFYEAYKIALNQYTFSNNIPIRNLYTETIHFVYILYTFLKIL